MNKLPYNNGYKVTVGLDLVGCERTETINPMTDSSYDQEEWESLTLQEQEQWLDEETKEWAMQSVEYCWEF